jgi:hypothetical protein
MSINVKQWRAIRKEAGLKIDPETAEVARTYTDVLDPYGVYPPPEECCIGRDYFARSPGSDIWVWFGDLPKETRDALWERHKHELAFPAGLEKLVEKEVEHDAQPSASDVAEAIRQLCDLGLVEDTGEYRLNPDGTLGKAWRAVKPRTP